MLSGLLTKLVKTIVSTNNNTVENSIADANTNTNAFVTIYFVVITFSNVYFPALHGMQTRASDENSVCLSICQTRGL